jgi:ribulose bisphosphate carboxylase small subunit
VAKKTAEKDWRSEFLKFAKAINHIDDTVGACEFDLGYSFWISNVFEGAVCNQPECQDENPQIVLRFMQGFLLGMAYERERAIREKSMRKCMLAELKRVEELLQKEWRKKSKKGR